MSQIIGIRAPINTLSSELGPTDPASRILPNIMPIASKIMFKKCWKARNNFYIL